MNPRRISFARALPIAALLLSFIIIAIPASMAYISFSSASPHGGDVILLNQKERYRVSHAHFLRTSVLGSAELTSHAIAAINLSGRLIEFGVERPLGIWPHGWPRGMPADAWKAIILPIYCIPFWWLAGLGMDALFRQRQLRWWGFLPGSLLCAFYLLLVVGFAVNVLLAKDSYPIALECGVSLWFILLSAFPIAWLKQALAWRRIRTSLQARLTAELQ